MHGEYQHKVDTTIDDATARELQRYCTTHGVKRREALRRAISLLLAGHREVPRIDPERPL